MSEVDNFSASYKKLNPNQKKAVDLIDGPAMVLAGPGTGKTQLLSARVANILKLTDVNPGNILCLTYTEAGVSAMRARLGEILGPSGYQVSVNTFHSFSLEVMRRFPDFFLESRGFEPIDELTSYQVIEQILRGLPPNFKLAYRTFAGEGRVKELTDKISELKKAVLSPEDAVKLAEENQKDLDSLKDLLELIPKEIPRAKATGLELISTLAEYLTHQPESPELTGAIKPLRSVIIEDLASAVLEANQSSKTSPITAWKNDNLEKDAKGNWKFKDLRFNQNLKEVAHIYKIYDAKLKELQKLEFDDMILNLTKALETQDELRFNVQEQWQYILVDEFQDTSFAQLEIIRLLGDSPTNNRSPNIMAVGDDDQAIYAFQGANVSNIQTFLNLYPSAELITLKENYRSNQAIITSSYQTAQFIEERPQGTEPKVLTKESLEAKNLEVEVKVMATKEAELSKICQDITKQIEAGAQPEEIAVLAPRHRYLQDLALELNQNNIPVYYESSSNILEDEVIVNLIDLSELVLQVAKGDLANSKVKLAEVLSAPYWGLDPGSVWELSLRANKQPVGERKHWLELLSEGALGEKGKRIHKQLIEWSAESLNSSLEQMLDTLIGAGDPDEDLSPFKSYYFSTERLKNQPSHYASFLSSLSTLRDHLRSYYADSSKAKLQDLVDYIELCRSYGGIRISRRGLHIDSGGVNLITAYGAKGLEFEQVYIIHSLDDVWSESARSRGGGIKFSANFASHKDSPDDKTRLFYVAQTRAKSRLVHTLHKFDEKGKQKVILRYLDPLKSLAEVKFNDLSADVLTAEESARAYEQKLFTQDKLYAEDSTKLAEILRPTLENYRLSATHLTTWLDDKYGGPEVFITRHLLRFPQAMTESAVHGSAVHKALEKAHLKFNLGKEVVSKDILEIYQKELAKCSLDKQTTNRMLEKAEYMFEKFDKAILKLIQTEALPEVDIKTNFEDIRLSGKLDAIVIDQEEGTATIRDYKTGKPGAYIEERYKNQLYFYRLLIELSPNRLPKDIKLTSAELIYLNPGEEDIVVQKLDYGAKESEYQEFKELVKKVWQEIMSLGI